MNASILNGKTKRLKSLLMKHLQRIQWDSKKKVLINFTRLIGEGKVYEEMIL